MIHRRLLPHRDSEVAALLDDRVVQRLIGGVQIDRHVERPLHEIDIRDVIEMRVREQDPAHAEAQRVRPGQ